MNIQAVKESFPDQGNLCIVYEYCDNDNLNKELRERFDAKHYFEEDELMNWFSHICHGLKYMHDMGIAHRQLDSKAILLHLVNEDTEGITLKISGFGEACKLDKTKNRKKETYESKYEQLKLLGQGSFGDVYRVKNRETG